MYICPLWIVIIMLLHACPKSLCLCLTLCDPMDHGPPGSYVHGFSRQESWSGLPFPSPGDLPNPGIEPRSVTSPALAGEFFTSSVTWEARHASCFFFFSLLLFSVTQSCPTFCNPMDCSFPGFPVLHHLPEFANSCPSSRWCHPTVSSVVVLFSYCLQSFPVSGSLPVSRLFASGGQSIEALASASVLPMNIQDWFPLELAGLISLQSTGLSRVFSNTTAQKHQFFGAQPSLWSNSHIHTRLLEKP